MHAHLTCIRSLVSGYLLFLLVLALGTTCARPLPAHADGEGSVPLPEVLIKVEYVAVPSPLVSNERRVADALTLAGEAHDVSVGYLSCLVWKEARWKPWAYVPADWNGQPSSGLGMLNAAGLLPDFYRQGYDDPFDPYQAADYLALRVAEGPRTVENNWYFAFQACR